MLKLFNSLLLLFNKYSQYLIAIGYIVIRISIVWNFEGDVIVYVKSLPERDDEEIIKIYREYLITKLLQILYEGLMVMYIVQIAHSNISITITNDTFNGEFIC